MARGEESIARIRGFSRPQRVVARCLRASLHDLPPLPAGPSRCFPLLPRRLPKNPATSIMPLVRSRRGVPSLEPAVESSGSPALPKQLGRDPANLTGGLTRCRVTRSPLVGFCRLGHRHTLAPLLAGPKTNARPSVVSHHFDSHTARALWACCIPLPIRGSSRFQPPCPGLVLGPMNRHPLRCRSEPDTRDLSRDAPTPRRTSACDSRYASLRPVLPPRGCSVATARPRSLGDQDLLHEALLHHSRGAGGFGCPPHARLHPSWALFPFEVSAFHSLPNSTARRPWERQDVSTVRARCLHLARRALPPDARPTPKSLP